MVHVVAVPGSAMLRLHLPSRDFPGAELRHFNSIVRTPPVSEAVRPTVGLPTARAILGLPVFGLVVSFTVTPIAERSDGLRTFLGLVCFLIAADLDVPRERHAV